MNTQKNFTTHFAPAGRSSLKQLTREQRAVRANDLVRIIMDAMPEPAMVLNGYRQIVGVNRKLLDIFGVSTATPFIGMRPGEAFSCIHHQQGPDGCGTTQNCSVCGAVMTILACMETKEQSVGECRLTVSSNSGTALDLEVVATPLHLDNYDFVVCAIRDISAEKRKSVMERTFFHDIINVAGGIRGLAALLAEPGNISQQAEQEYKQWILTLSGNLIEDIKHQRDLLAAEKGEYAPRHEEVDLSAMVSELKELFVHHEKAPGRDITIENSIPKRITTDPPILRRIVGNMVLNALEATPKGETIALRYRATYGKVIIEVENPGEIPPDVQLQIFKRSFSTKSAYGRGIGTYSMKLFGERYLGGKVSFTSANGRTVFSITVPCKDCKSVDKHTYLP